MLKEKIKAMDEALNEIISCAHDRYMDAIVVMKERRIIVKEVRTAWQELKAELEKDKYIDLEKAYKQGIYDCAHEEAVCHFCVNGAAELEAIKIENERLKAMLSILSGKVKCITSDMDDNLPCNQYSNCEDCKRDWAYKLVVNKVE